jgi:hypothetical protein
MCFFTTAIYYIILHYITYITLHYIKQEADDGER